MSEFKFDSNVLPDIKFSIFDNDNRCIAKYVNLENPKQRNGSIQTMIEVHSLMNSSLALVSPFLLFTPDFPDYLLPVDDPNYLKTSPLMSVSDNIKMPHHRNDIWQHSYNDYDSLEKVPIPHITWGVVRQEPGTMGSTPFSGTQEIKPRIREYLGLLDTGKIKHMGMDPTAIPEHLTCQVQIEGQVFDNLVQYNIWARSAWEAEELKEWFQEYMRKFTGMYREAGVNQLFFYKCIRDDTIMQRKNGYHLRSLLYYFRTEHIHIHKIGMIKRIDVQVQTVLSLDKAQSLNNLDDTIIKQDNLLSKWHNVST